MGKLIVIIQGHPDALQHHYGHALAKICNKRTAAAGHKVKTISVL
jgi:hypothetical protein